jgi:hypothetical protein
MRPFYHYLTRLHPTRLGVWTIMSSDDLASLHEAMLSRHDTYAGLSPTAQLLILKHGFQHVRDVYCSYWQNFGVVSALIAGLSGSAILSLLTPDYDRVNHTVVQLTLVTFSLTTLSAIVVIAFSLAYVTHLGMLVDDDDILWFLSTVSPIIPDVVNSITMITLVTGICLTVSMSASPNVTIFVACVAVISTVWASVCAAYLDYHRRKRAGEKLRSLVLEIANKNAVPAPSF